MTYADGYSDLDPSPAELAALDQVLAEVAAEGWDGEEQEMDGGAELARAQGTVQLDLANVTYSDVLEMTNAQYARAGAVAADDAAEDSRRSRRAAGSTEDRLARAYARVARGTYGAAALQFSNPSAAARELARVRWGGIQPGTVTGRPACGAVDEFGYCVEPDHSPGCGSLATTEIGEALRDSGAYARLAARPFTDANGRQFTDQFGQPLTATGHLEAATGERLGNGSVFETGYGARELLAPQRQAVFGDPDDPHDSGAHVPHTTAATVAAYRAQAGLGSSTSAADARERYTDRRTAALVDAMTRGGAVARPDDRWDMNTRRERVRAERGSGTLEAVGDGENGALPQYRLA